MSQYRQSPFANIPPVVKNLLIINILCYLAELIFKSHFNLDMFAAYYFDSPLFKPWQIITYMFMHSIEDPMHIIGNMFALFIFGPTLEYTLGSKRFFNYYFICGIGAVLMQNIVQGIEVYNIAGTFTAYHSNISASPDVIQKIEAIYGNGVVGASGAIFGILLAFGMLFPNVELFVIPIPFPIKAKYLVSCYILLELWLGYKQYSGDNVAHFAHIGGALVGFIIIKIWGLRGPQQFY